MTPGHQTCRMPSMHRSFFDAPELSAIALEARMRVNNCDRWERPSRQCGSATYSSSTTFFAPPWAAVKGHAQSSLAPGDAFSESLPAPCLLNTPFSSL